MRLPADANDITEALVKDLSDRGIGEGPQLDYKKALLPLNHDAKFELLKDVSAFANTSGGLLLYGCGSR